MKKIVNFGEVLLRLSPPGNLRFAQASSYEVTVGGAEANIAISLAQYGNEAHFVTVVPRHELGGGAVRELRKWGVNVDQVQYAGDKMGLYFLEKGASLRGGDIIYDRAGSSICFSNEHTFDWEAILDGADWFHCTGITPALSHGAASATLKGIEIAHKKGITVSCDLNYRSKLWKYGARPSEIMPELISNCTVVLANETDVEEYLEIKPLPDDFSDVEGFGSRCYEFVSKALVSQFPNIKCVISTLRETINASHNKWTGIVFENGEFIRGSVYDIPFIVDRVGGGDSFMAAFIHGKLNLPNTKKALDFALAASAFKLSMVGDVNIASESEIVSLMNQQGIGRINR